MTWNANGTDVKTETIPGTPPQTSASVTLTALFQLGTHNITVTVSDGQGGAANCSFTFTVVDTTPPSVGCPLPTTMSADSQCQAPVPDLTTKVIASDICTPTANLVITQAPAAGILVSLGTHTITVQVTDASGNKGSCATTFTVADTTPPQIMCPADIVAANDPGQCSVAVNYPSPVATDNCSGVSIACNPPSGSFFPVGTTTVTCTATDAASNSATCTFTVTVTAPPRDAEPPVAGCTPTTNPSGNNEPNAGNNPKSGQNPDGFYQLLATDNFDPSSAIRMYIKDSASDFVAGPFKSGDKVKITQAPGVKPNSKPMTGEIIAHIQFKGDALVYGVDSSGNVSTPHNCLVAPKPK